MNILNIIKQHRYETVCAVLALLILLALWPAGRLGSQARTKTDELKNWQSRASRVQRPGPDGLATASLVQARQDYVQQVAEEFEKVAELFRQKNQRAFLVVGMFPESVAEAPLRFRTRYNQAIDELLTETLRAGWPEDQEPTTAEGKTAPAIYLYAQRDDLSVGEWASDADVPNDEDCWFAQLGLWIQEDLAKVFRELNDASAQQPSVENAAVKRIISINVYPYYYVGLEKQTSQPTQTVPSMMPPGTMPAGTGGLPGMFPMGPGPGGWQIPPSPTTARRAKRARSTGVQGEPFTERICDDKADVLHFSFSVVVDSRRINELLTALSRKNLYTILKVTLSREDVKIDTHKFPKSDRSYDAFDPYDDAGQGLVYGTDPIVRLDVDVEALFLRDIYAEYMPKEVKDLLLAETDAARQKQLDKQREYEKARKAAAAKKKPRSRRKKSRTKSR